MDRWDYFGLAIIAFMFGMCVLTWNLNAQLTRDDALVDGVRMLEHRK